FILSEFYNPSFLSIDFESQPVFELLGDKRFDGWTEVACQHHEVIGVTFVSLLVFLLDRAEPTPLEST
ncbi:MAG: hypothetical protein QOH31_338, partial [Verrucomicrobiota bacterium]